MTTLLVISVAAALAAAATAQSAVWNYGHSRPSAADHLPAVDSTGGLPDLGNAAFGVGMVRGVGGSLAVLVVGLGAGETPVPWGTLWVDPVPPGSVVASLAVLDGATGQPGAGSKTLPLPIPASPQLVAAELFVQWFALDAGVPSGVTHSDALGLRIGDPAATQQCANSLAMGDHVRCALASGAFRMFPFVAAAGDVVFVRAVAAGFQARVQLFDPAGSLVHDLDPGCNDRTEITSPLAASGTWHVLVRDGLCGGPSQAGTFGLYLQRANGAVAPPLARGSSLTGQLRAMGEAVAFTFPATAGDNFLLRATASGQQARCLWFDPAGNQTTFGAGCNDLLERRQVTATITGTHSLLIMDDACGGSQQTGNWSVFLQQLADPGSALAFPLGRTLTTGVATAGAANTCTVALASGDVLFARLVASGHQPWLTLFDPNGVEVGNAMAGCSDELEFVASPATGAGNYTVVVRDAACGGNRQSGAYGVYLQNLVQPVTGLMFPLNTTQTVPVARSGVVAPVKLVLTAAATTLVLTLTATALQPAFALYGPGANLIESVDPGCNPQSSRTWAGLPPGDYLLQVHDGNCGGSAQVGNVMVSAIAL